MAGGVEEECRTDVRYPNYERVICPRSTVRSISKPGESCLRFHDVISTFSAYLSSKRVEGLMTDMHILCKMMMSSNAEVSVEITYMTLGFSSPRYAPRCPRYPLCHAIRTLISARCAWSGISQSNPILSIEVASNSCHSVITPSHSPSPSPSPCRASAPPWASPQHSVYALTAHR